jgi:diguanylate cyclase (GGDEF)-like protein/PAS domain S-box-containing protein
MNVIDMKTLIMNQSVIYLVCMVVITLLWWQNRSRFAGLAFWLVSFTTSPLSMGLIFLRGVIPDWLSIVIGGNALPLGGAILMYVGLERFVGRRSSPGYHLALLAISMSIHAYFTFVHLNLPARNINISLALCIVHAQTVWLMLRGVQPEIRPITRRIGIVYSVFVLVHLARIITNIFKPSGNNFLTESSTLDAFLLFSYQILFFAAVFVLFLAINHRLFLALQTQQRQVEAQNLELRKLWLAIEKSGNAVVITNKRGEIEYANPSFEKSSGYPLREIIGKTPRVLKSGEQSAEVYQNVWQTITSGQIWRGEFHNRHKDGTFYWEDTTIAPVQDGAGQVTSYIAIKIDITERKQMETKLEQLATTDDLTGVLNRRQMTTLADQELERAHRYHHPTSAIILDIDFFKKINDHYGHATGDLAIKHVAQILRDNLRHVDYLGRYGGDEFTIVMPETNAAGAQEIAERLRSAVEQRPLPHNPQAISLSISLGVACIAGVANQPIIHFDGAIQLADHALYAAKSAGRNCFRMYHATALPEDVPCS